MSTTQSSKTQPHRLQGVVVSTAMAKTAVIRVDRRVMHEKYGKYFTISKKFKVHDETGAAHMGDIIEIEECRPVSRDKNWRYLSTIKAA